MTANDSAPTQPLILLGSMRGQCVCGWRSEQLIAKCQILTIKLKLKHTIKTHTHQNVNPKNTKIFGELGFGELGWSQYIDL